MNTGMTWALNDTTFSTLKSNRTFRIAPIFGDMAQQPEFHWTSMKISARKQMRNECVKKRGIFSANLSFGEYLLRFMI